MGVASKFISVAMLLSAVASSLAQEKRYIAGHEYVDMGLSVNWATCNIGSYCPEGFGDYFAWGETYTKSCYNDMTYRYSGEVRWDYTKYQGDKNKQVEYDQILKIEDDAARQNWGEPWRMPTKNEIEELINNCEWTFDYLNDVSGYWAISKINGGRVFFPLSGYIIGLSLLDIGKSGKFWSSELRPDMCFEAYQLWISYDDNLAKQRKKISIFLSDDGKREDGRPIRAVCDR